MPKIRNYRVFFDPVNPTVETLAPPVRPPTPEPLFRPRPRAASDPPSDAAPLATPSDSSPTSIPELETQLEDARREAYDEGLVAGESLGYQRGVEEGRAAVRVEFEAKLQAERSRIDTLAEQLRCADEARAADARKWSAKLAVAIASRLAVIRFRSPEVLRRRIEEVLSVDAVRTRGEFVVRVSPDAARSLASFDLPFTVEADDALASGDVVVHTPRGSVEARVDEQLARLAEVLGV